MALGKSEWYGVWLARERMMCVLFKLYSDRTKVSIHEPASTTATLDHICKDLTLQLEEEQYLKKSSS